MKKLILAAVTGLVLASTGAAMAAPYAYQAQVGRDTGAAAPNFGSVNPTGGN